MIYLLLVLLQGTLSTNITLPDSLYWYITIHQVGLLDSSYEEVDTTKEMVMNLKVFENGKALINVKGNIAKVEGFDLTFLVDPHPQLLGGYERWKIDYQESYWSSGGFRQMEFYVYRQQPEWEEIKLGKEER